MLFMVKKQAPLDSQYQGETVVGSGGVPGKVLGCMDRYGERIVVVEWQNGARSNLSVSEYLKMREASNG